MNSDTLDPVAPMPPANSSLPRLGSRRGRIAGLIAGVLVIALIALAIIHYTGPARTVQSFMNDLFVSDNGSDAYYQLCSDVQARISASTLQLGANYYKTQLQLAHATADTSGITYTTVDENFFGTAHVRIGGTASIIINGRKQSSPFNGMGSLVTLRSIGFGWCIEGIPGITS